MSLVRIPPKYVFSGLRSRVTRGEVAGSQLAEAQMVCDRCGHTEWLTDRRIGWSTESIGKSDITSCNGLYQEATRDRWTSYVVVTGRDASNDGPGSMGPANRFASACRTGMLDLCRKCRIDFHAWLTAERHAREIAERIANAARAEEAARAEAARIAEEHRLAEEARLAAEEAERLRIESERLAREALIESTRQKIAKLGEDAARFAKRKHTAKAVDAFLERDRLRDELAALVAA